MSRYGSMSSSSSSSEMDANLRVTMTELEPFLRERLEYIEENDFKKIRFAEQFEQIHLLLSVITNCDMVGIQDMMRNDPIPQEWLQRQRSTVTLEFYPTAIKMEYEEQSTEDADADVTLTQQAVHRANEHDAAETENLDAEIESLDAAPLEQELHENNDPPAQLIVKVEQTPNVEDASIEGESERGSVAVKQEPDYEIGELALGLESEEAYRVQVIEVDELLARLLTFKITVKETSTNELDNREEPETAAVVATATPGPSIVPVQCPVPSNGAGKEPEQPAMTTRHRMTLRSHKTAPPPPPPPKLKPQRKERGGAKKTKQVVEMEDEEAEAKREEEAKKEEEAKREEEARKLFEARRTENGLRVITLHDTLINPYLRMIKFEPDLPEGIKVEVESP